LDRQRSLVWTLTTLAVVSLFARELADLAVDGLWFASVEHSPVFWTLFGARALAFVGGVLLGAVVIGGSAAVALNAQSGSPILLLDGQVQLSPWAQAPKVAGTAVQVVVAGACLLLGLSAQAAWPTWMAWWHQVPFGEVDAVLGYDASLYVFTIPALMAARNLLLVTLFVATVVSTATYAARGTIRVRLPSELDPDAQPQIRTDARTRRHLALLVASFAMVLAVGPFLQRFDALSSSRGLFDGPGYTVVTTVLPLLSLSAVATLFAAWLVFTAIDRMRGAPAMLALFLVFAAGALQSFVPDTVQRFVVAPNELGKERPYISAHIEATRKAWRLDGVEEERLGADANLTLDDIDANRTTIEGIRLWDEAPLRDTFQQVQEIRTYYEFHHVDHDRYEVDGQLRQVMLSARELEPAGLPQQAKTWVNQTLVYTHGYGVTVGPVNEVTDDGLPVLWVKDIPPATDKDIFRVDQPAIYFGEEMRRPVIVRTNQPEFDYPTAEGNETARYEGEAGIPVGGLARRTLLSMVLGDMDVILNGDISTGSRLLYVRDVRRRVQKLAPFLWVDQDAYLAVIDGRLLWFLDGFTHTDRYPYSAPRMLPGTRRSRPPVANWVRNRVKITVDAYDGTVTLWRMPGDDPILDTWASAFPDLLRDAAEMPEAVRAHVRVPDALFHLQADLFATYHMTDAETFYNREDQWEIPTIERQRMVPYYTVMKLPGETRDEFILMLPFTPRDKDNLAAWMVARNDGENYGTLRVYRFPKDRLVYGPGQVVARIQQDDAISEKLTLWNQQGSRAILGTLLVIPIEESLLYVQPLYLQAADGAIPELKRVIVGYRDEIAMEPTLEGALTRLFGGASADTVATIADAVDAAAEAAGDEATTLGHAVRRAQSPWLDARNAAKDGRFGDMGQAFERLGAAIDKLAEMAEVNVDPPTADTDAR